MSFLWNWNEMLATIFNFTTNFTRKLSSETSHSPLPDIVGVLTKTQMNMKQKPVVGFVTCCWGGATDCVPLVAKRKINKRKYYEELMVCLVLLLPQPLSLLSLSVHLSEQVLMESLVWEERVGKA